MTFILKLKRECPYCMALFGSSIKFPFTTFIFKEKFVTTNDYLEMTMADVEPIIYHPLTKTFIVGVPLDKRIIDNLILFLFVFDFELSKFIDGKLPVPEEPDLIEKVYGRNIDIIANIVKENKEIYQTRVKEGLDKVESEILDRIRLLLTTI